MVFNANAGKGKAKGARDFMDNPPAKKSSNSVASESIVDQLDAFAAGGGLNNKAEEAIQMTNKGQTGR